MMLVFLHLLGQKLAFKIPSKAPAPIAKDAYSAYNPYGTTAATTTGVKSDDYGNVQDPSEIPTEKTTFDSIVGKEIIKQSMIV